MSISLKRSLPVEDNCSAKRPLLIEDDDEPFNLEGLIPDLFGSIVEKMFFDDFKTFNSVSKLSADMCSSRKELEAEVEKEAESFQVDKTKKEISCLKQNVRLFAKTLEIDKPCLNAILKHNIKANCVEFFDDAGIDHEFVRNVLELTNAKRAEFSNVTMKTLQLESLKKLKLVRVWPCLEFNDKDLLSLKLEEFHLAGDHENCSITMNGVLELLQEWKRGEREIKGMQILANRFNAKTILNEFPGHPQKPSLQMTLCREDGHSDLLIDVTRTGIVKLRSVPCPGCGQRVPQGPTRPTPYAFRGRRRNRPL